MSASSQSNDGISVPPEPGQLQLAALTAAMEEQRPNLLPLDLSYDSLDRVEDFYAACLDRQDGGDGDLDMQITGYLGATLVRKTGGRWDPPRNRTDFGKASIIRLPHLARARFYPLDVVRTYKRLRTPGYLCDTTQLYDIPLRRASLAQLLAEGDAALTVLHANIGDLLGRDPGPLDGSTASVAALEEAIKRFHMGLTPRDRLRLRSLHSGAILYLGQIVQHSVDGEWTVCEDPKDIDVGQFRIHGWSPFSVVRNVGAESRPNLLQNMLETVIRARSSA